MNDLLNTFYKMTVVAYIDDLTIFSYGNMLAEVNIMAQMVVTSSSMWSICYVPVLNLRECNWIITSSNIRASLNSTASEILLGIYRKHIKIVMALKINIRAIIAKNHAGLLKSLNSRRACQR